MSSFDLRLSTLRAVYHAGTITPRKLIGELLAKAAALNPEFNLFIHLLSEAEVAPYLDTGWTLRITKHYRFSAFRSRSRTTSTWPAFRPRPPVPRSPIRRPSRRRSSRS